MRACLLYGLKNPLKLVLSNHLEGPTTSATITPPFSFWWGSLLIQPGLQPLPDGRSRTGLVPLLLSGLSLGGDDQVEPLLLDCGLS